MCNGMGKWKDVHRRHAAALYVRPANTGSGRHHDRLRRYRNEPGDHSTAWVWRSCPAAAGAVEAVSAGAGIRAVAVATQLEDSRQYAVGGHIRSEEHTSELQSLMRSSYAVF